MYFRYEAKCRRRVCKVGEACVDDELVEAQYVEIGSSLRGNIYYGFDVDMYVFYIDTANRRLGIDIDVDLSFSPPLDAYIRLFDINGVQLAANDDTAGPLPENSSLESYLEYSFPQTGFYYLGISAFGNSNYNASAGSGDQTGSTDGFYQVFFRTLTATPNVVITSNNRPYNGTVYAATASVTGFVSPDPSSTLSFVYYSDAAGTLAIPAPRNVGTYYVQASTLANSGNAAARSPIVPFLITPRAILGDITVADKVFDGTTVATILLRRVSGVLETDMVSYVGGTANFDTPSIGNNKTVTATGLSLVGVDAGNYVVNTTAITIARITTTDDSPPIVTEAFAAGSNWSTSFIDAVDNAGVGLGNGLGHLLTSGLTIANSGVNRIYIQFSEPVLGFNATNVRLLGVNVLDYTNTPSLLSVMYEPATMRGVIAMAGSNTIAKDKLRIGISDAVTDTASNRLDGDLNGSSGGVFSLRFNVLVGDANNDGNVNGGDMPPFATAFNKSAGVTGYNPRADWNSDTSVNGGDLPFFAAHFNQSLPIAEPGTIAFPPPPLDPLFNSGVDSLYAPLIVDEDDIDSVFRQLGID